MSGVRCAIRVQWTLTCLQVERGRIPSPASATLRRWAENTPLELPRQCDRSGQDSATVTDRNWTKQQGVQRSRPDGLWLKWIHKKKSLVQICTVVDDRNTGSSPTSLATARLFLRLWFLEYRCVGYLLYSDPCTCTRARRGSGDRRMKSPHTSWLSKWCHSCTNRHGSPSLLPVWPQLFGASMSLPKVDACCSTEVVDSSSHRFVTSHIQPPITVSNMLPLEVQSSISKRKQVQVWITSTLTSSWSTWSKTRPRSAWIVESLRFRLRTLNWKAALRTFTQNKFSSLSAPTKIEELTAGSDEKTREKK